MHCTAHQLAKQMTQGADHWSAVADPPVQCVVVDLQGVDAVSAVELAVLPTCPVIGVNSSSTIDSSGPPEFVDLLAANPAELEHLSERICAQPIASAVLVQLLRQTLSLTVGQALMAESLAYSSLQHGAEFEGFLAENHRGKRPSDSQAEPAVLLAREADELRLTLNRPAKRNAFSAAMRDALCEALQLVCLDNSVSRVVLSGAGQAFCAGGDLDEFGQARDAAVAHLSRSALSAGLMLAKLAPKVTACVHGACIGAGIELPAFGGRVVAHPKSFFQLPEVGMGLVPGAGGTVSLPRRIGRHRTAWLALSGQRVDAATALEWGLVDELNPAV